MRTMRCVAFAVLAAALSPAAAQDAKTEIGGACKAYEEHLKANAAATQGWPMAAAMAKDIGERYCSGVLSPEKVTLELFGFLVATAAALEEMDIKQDVFPWRERLAGVKPEIDAGGHLPNMAVLQVGLDTGLRFRQPVRVADVPKCDQAVVAARDASRVRAGSCRELLVHYQAIYAGVHHLLQKEYAKHVREYLDVMQRKWDDFLEKSRSQTWWELAVNSRLWRQGKKSGEFLEPPDRQWILFHPSVVLEHVSKAADGNRTEEGLMIEVVGANWWQNDKWYQPSGASYVWVYSDRAGLRDWTNGVAVHFANKYTIGATRRDGRTGYFLSVDVLELYKDKKKTLDEYTTKLPLN